MLALRLTRSAHPAVQLRRLLVAAASAGTGFLLLSTLGHALTHPEAPASAALRLAWCAAPLAATVYLARAVARTDPGTRPRPGLAAIGLGPTRLMVVSATTTALSTLLGSMLALLLFLHLRGDLTGMPFDGAASDFLAASRPLPLPAALTLLSLVPAASSVTVALMLRPRDARVAARATPRLLGRFGASGTKGPGETFGAYGRYGAHRTTTSRASRPSPDGEPQADDARNADGRRQDDRADRSPVDLTADGPEGPDDPGARERAARSAAGREHGTAAAGDRTGRAEDGRTHRTPDDRTEPDGRTASGAGDEATAARAARSAGGDDSRAADPRGSRRPAGGGDRDALRRTVPAAVGRTARTARTVTEHLTRPDGPDARPANGTDARPAADRGEQHEQPTDGRPANGGPGPAAEDRPAAEGRPTAPRAAADVAPQGSTGDALPPADGDHAGDPADSVFHASQNPPAPDPTALPWGAALLAAGLAVEGYASRTADGGGLPLPGGLPEGPAAVFFGWFLTVLGLALAGPGLTHLCGRLLQAARPGALRLLAGRGLMQEASRIGRPLGVVCAVASGGYTMAALYDPADPSFGPLSTLGALVVAGCTVATLLTSAVEARQARADTTAALLRLGAPTKTLRSAAALRAGALLALFVPLTLVVAELAALPLAR
ncbi:hypothetical protein QF032_005547 [Streptomyces achromogenes]|nr:hypothetical protein [Streptomyces achromogenes]